MGLTLGKALRLLPRTQNSTPAVGRPSASIAFVGAGGKTTTLFSLAHELGQPTLVTTTTHLGAWQAQHADRHLIAESPADLTTLGQPGVTLVTGPSDSDNRLTGVGPSVMNALHEAAQSGRGDLLIEADGARQKSLKAPGSHEPHVPPFVEMVVVVSGLHGLGAALGDETVHRSEIFGILSGLKLGQTISAQDVVRVLLHDRGGLQGIPPHARRVVLLNQADGYGLQAQAQGMAEPLLEAYHAVIASNMRDAKVHALYEGCAGIVLAAGSATRFGAPKQLLQWRGQPLVRIAAQSALEAGLAPIVIVTGAYADQVRPALDGLPVQMVENPNWQAGQGSSVAAGVAALPVTSGAAVFLLADQPLVTPILIRALVEAHASGDACIVVPLIEDGRRGNPVLFDRETFPRLRALVGDAGGRSIFPDFGIQYLPWHDAAIAHDIDTPGDYEQLLETEP